MSKLEVLEYINVHNKEHGGVFVTKNGFRKYFPELYEEMMNMTFPSFFDDFDFKQKLWHFLRDDYTEHLCKCGGKLKFRSFWFGYNEYCRPNCPSMIENQVKCVKESNETKTIEDKKKIQEKVRDTFLKKYGVERYSQTKEWKEKTLLRNNEKFGKDWYTQTDKYKNDYKECSIKKYGVSNPMFCDKVREKWKSNCDNYYNEYLLRKYPNIISIDGNDVTCRCTNCECNLCSEKTFVISKHILYERTCCNIDICTTRTPGKTIYSGGEKELFNFISSVYSGTIIENDRSIINGKEIDIYLPELKIGFEFNGIYWHSELYKDRNYHQKKSLECMNKGIHLIHIWEDDWNVHQDSIKDFILSKLNVGQIGIGARKCNVVNVSNKDAILFYENNHIQGGVRNGKTIGLMYNGEIVELMTFGQCRKNMGGNPTDGEYEIYRVCSKCGYNIQGGFSKLLKYFEDTYRPTCVITYANLDYSIGNVYIKNGFTKDSLSKPSYTWVVDNIRRYRSNYTKSKLDECKENPKLTEVEVMYNRGCWRCWDSGKIRFVKNIKT